MRKHILFFIFYATMVALIVTGVIPRSGALVITVLTAIYLFWAPLENGALFFMMGIPLFIALPITETFDNFNNWRIFSIILFLKFCWISRKKWRNLFKPGKVTLIFYGLLILSAISLIFAPYPLTGVRRIIYFINASFIGIVVYGLAKLNPNFIRNAVRVIAVPLIIVVAVGYIQLISTYFIDIYQFMRIWGEEINLRLFGSTWSYIAVNVGNTWFAYFGDQLSLRVFSLFPDSHSFPIFVILTLPALFAIALVKPASEDTFRQMIKCRGSLLVLLIPLIFLIIILSGTRGIWAGSIAGILWVMVVLIYLRRIGKVSEFRLLSYLTSYLAIFFLMFMIAYPIFASPQFLLSKGSDALLRNRIRSIIDFGETSNSQRIEIWKQTFQSIKSKPFVGVGLGNYPVVLGQNINLSRAGSSAHNLYLHIWSEVGTLGLMLCLWLVWLLLKTTIANFTMANEIAVKIFFGMMILSLAWVFAYVLTDITLFDERALLMFAIVSGLIFGYKKGAYAR